MASTSDPISRLISVCDKEPIHIPGSIQPFGVLMTIDPQTFIIQNLSENCLKLWDRHSFALLGRSLNEFLSEQGREALAAYLAAATLAEQDPLRITLSFDDYGNREWEMRAHRHGDTLFLEWESVKRNDPGQTDSDRHLHLRHAVRALKSAGSLQEMCDRAAQEVKALTGFDRVMVYRFEEDWHGIVIAEAVGAGVDSYLGLHFPASDIPPQARAIFLQNSLRMIPEVDYIPARIYPGKHPDSGQALDLSRAVLRSVSPVHLEYLKNMGVRASLTISLVSEGKLWGLIACHHASPLRMTTDQRIAVELIGQFVSSQVRTKEEEAQREDKALQEQRLSALMRGLEGSEDLAQGLAAHAGDLLNFSASPVGGVAICYGDQWTVAGDTPSVADMEYLLAWLAERVPNQGVFHTHHLCAHVPQAQACKAVASGLLSMSITRSPRDAILWFRPEVSATVTWAGEPAKAVRQDEEGLRLHPRRSFSAWKEDVAGMALRWKAAEIEAVEKLRNEVIAIALRQEHRKEQQARKRAEQLSREKDEMVTMVSHDLKTPLNVIALSFDFLRRAQPNAEPSVKRMVERGARAVKSMGNLVTNILDVAKIEAGTLDLALKPENAVELIREVVDLSMPVAQEKGVHLIAAVQDDGSYRACCEHFRIVQVLGNLVGNAVKFTAPGGKVEVSVHKHDTDLLFTVQDTGEGIQPDNLERIFDRYWQAEDTKRLGTGLGLWIAKGIIENHHGRIWATSELGKGSTFFFTLPRGHC